MVYVLYDDHMIFDSKAYQWCVRIQYCPGLGNVQALLLVADLIGVMRD